MAVFCEFINVIFPIYKINEVYKGGFEKFKLDNKEMFMGKYWHDEHLFRDGAMNSIDVKAICEYWESKGLVGLVKKNNEEYWEDFCVVTMTHGVTKQCSWVEYDDTTSSVFLKEKSKGIVITGPNR